MKLLPRFARCDHPCIAVADSVACCDFAQRHAIGVKPPYLFGFGGIQFQVTRKLSVSYLVNWLQVLNIYTGRVVAKVVQVNATRKWAMLALVEEAVRDAHLSAVVKKTVPTRVRRSGPNMTRRFVAAVLNLPTLKWFAHGMSAINIPRRTPAHEPSFPIRARGYRGFLTTSTPAIAVGNVCALFPRLTMLCLDAGDALVMAWDKAVRLAPENQRPAFRVSGDVCARSAPTTTEAVGNVRGGFPPQAILFGSSGYSFDVATSSLGSGRASGRSNVAGAFCISKPNYTTGAMI